MNLRYIASLACLGGWKLIHMLHACTLLPLFFRITGSYITECLGTGSDATAYHKIKRLL